MQGCARDDGRRRRFFASYVGDLIDRDVTQLADISRRDVLHRLLAALAARASQPLSVANVASDLGVPSTTVERYIALLEEVFLVKRLPAFVPAGVGRATHQRKLVFVDTGIAAHLRGHGAARLERDRTLLGPLFENLVLGELARQVGLSEETVTLSHYRTRDGVEVDGLIEHADGRVVAVEVKAAETVRAEDVRHLRHLQQRLGERFCAGIVLHLGSTLASLGSGMWAVPVDRLWKGLAPSMTPR